MLGPASVAFHAKQLCIHMCARVWVSTRPPQGILTPSVIAISLKLTLPLRCTTAVQVLQIANNEEIQRKKIPV